MATWRPVSLDVVLRSWGIAEATSTKESGFSAEVARQAPAIHGKLLRAEPLSEAELDALARGIEQYRAPLISGLQAVQPQWFEGVLPVQTLAEMRFFNMNEWSEKAPSRMFGDLAGTRTIAGTQPEFRGFATSVERPIAVAPSLDGPFCLVEGYTRCAAIVRDHRAGLSATGEVPMIVGVTLRITAWSNGRGHAWW